MENSCLTLNNNFVDKNLNIYPNFKIRIYDSYNNIFNIYKPLPYKWVCLTNRYPISNSNITDIRKINFLFNGYPKTYYKAVVKDVTNIKCIRVVNVFIDNTGNEKHISPCHLDVYIKGSYMILKDFNIANIRHSPRPSDFYNRIITVWIKKPESIFTAMDKLKSIQEVVKVDYHYF